MYSILKKKLLVLAILALPIMTPAAMAMDEDQISNTCRAIVVYKEPNLEVFKVTKPVTAIVLNQDEPKSTGKSYAGAAVQFGVDALVWGLSTIVSHKNMAIGLVGLSYVGGAAACLCTCLPDALHKDSLVIGEQPWPDYCKLTCGGTYGYFGDTTCK